jgi:hypothetical protein
MELAAGYAGPRALMAEKSLQETIAELVETPEVHAKLWKAITDAEVSDDPKILKKAQRLRRRREAFDRARGLTRPDA